MSRKPIVRKGTPATKRGILRQVVQGHVEAAIADSWKGGGNPADIPVIEAELTLSHARFERLLLELFPDDA